MSGKLGKYEIIREIARSNDIVYEGFDPTVNRRVAVKELAMPGGQTAEQRQDRLNRFLREARAAGSLVHPNIVTIYEVGEDQGRQFIAMEYLDGRNLRQEIESAGFIEQGRAIEIATEVLQGLAYAHANGIVHRDIKPENIQILSTGRVKITDFGIARITFEPNLTISGQVFGTPSYMAPEQVTGADVTPQTDLFAVGVLLYEMVAGQKPFSGDSVPAITHQIMNARPTQPPQAGWGLWQAIEQALEKSAALRFASAEAFITALRDSAFVPAPPPQMAPTGYGMTAYGAPPAYPSTAPSAPPVGMHQPYNPYGAAPQGPMMVPPPGGAPNLTQLPLYYPSKMPRPPILSADAKRGLGRAVLYVILALTLIGLAVGLVAGGIWFADNVAAEAGSPSPSQGAPAQGAPALGPPSEAAPAGDADPGPDAGRLLAEAEQAVRTGAAESFDLKRREAWDRATELIVEAVEADFGREPQIRVRGAELFFAAAQDLAAQGERSRALEALSRASGLLPEGSGDYRRQIEALELSLSRR